MLENLPRGHMEKDVFIASNQDFYCLVDGTQLTRTEMYARFAAQSPWGVYPYDNIEGASYYVDTNGDKVKALGTWTVADPFHEKYGVAWVVPVNDFFFIGPVSLLGVDGHIISEGWEPRYFMNDFDFYEGLFPISQDGTYGNYIRPDGSLLYEGFPFQYVANFSNGLASVIFMGSDYALYNAYIAPDGSVVWAEDGQEEWLTQRLDDGIFPRISDITIEDASRMLQGNWKCVSGGDALDDLVFEEDGSYQSIEESAARWKLRENYSEKNSYTLEIWSEENELLDSYGLSFRHSDFMSLRHGEGGTDLARVGSSHPYP